MMCDHTEAAQVLAETPAALGRFLGKGKIDKSEVYIFDSRADHHEYRSKAMEQKVLRGDATERVSVFCLPNL